MQAEQLLNNLIHTKHTHTNSILVGFYRRKRRILKINEQVLDKEGHDS